ncbi:unnamed protein product [[Candida] boidinii]|nr:unnamed protein product [[Candida] boidinii]GMF83079.1 unnamed protein product [[Candida] boidinii]
MSEPSSLKTNFASLLFSSSSLSGGVKLKTVGSRHSISTIFSGMLIKSVKYSSSSRATTDSVTDDSVLEAEFST